MITLVNSNISCYKVNNMDKYCTYAKMAINSPDVLPCAVAAVALIAVK